MTEWPAHDDCKSECWFAPTLRAMRFDVSRQQVEISRLTAERDQLAAQYTTACRAIDQIAAERDALRAENERLREALRKLEVGLDFIAADDTTEDARMAVRLLPIARAALAKGGE